MRPRAILLAAALLAACGRHDRSDIDVGFDSSHGAVADEVLGPGDVRITSTDGSVVMALVGDTVRMQLSDSLRQHVKQQLDSSTEGGLGGMITRSVSGIVGSAMGFVMRIPVRDIEEIRYEDGKLELQTRGSNHVSFSGKGEGKGRFSAEDGERFVAAVKARKAALR